MPAWCNSGMIVLNVVDYFLIRFKACNPTCNSFLDYVLGQKSGLPRLWAPGEKLIILFYGFTKFYKSNVPIFE